MNLIPKRLTVLTLIGLLLISGAFANGIHAQDTPVPPAGTPPPLPATKPVIHGARDGSPIESIPSSYCWPTTDASPLCDVIDDPQPPTGVTVANGESIVFTVDPASPAPQTLTASLLDDKNADGEAPQTNLIATGGIFTIASLSAGPHRVEVIAAYEGDVQGNQPFVTNVFLLNVAAGGASPATEAPAGSAATGGAATPAGVAPTVAGAAPTEAAAPTLAPVATEAPPANVVAPTVGPDTPVPPTATSSAPIIDTSGIPGMTVYPVVSIVAGRTYDPIAVNICVKGSQDETVCVSRPTKTTIQRILAVPGSVAQFNFQGPRPTAITVTQYSSDGSTLIGKQTLLPDNLVLYTLPGNTGTFVLNVEITYPDGKANYYFRFNIG